MSTRSRLIHLALAVALACLAALAGCSASGRFDVAEAREEIEAVLDSRFRTEARSLRCPEDVRAERGTTFRCTGTDQRGRRFELKVRLLDDEGGFTFEKPDFERPMS